MLRLATAIIWLLGSAGTLWASIEMLRAGADPFTILVIVDLALLGGAIPATLFYGVCKAFGALFSPRVVAPAAASTPRKGFSLPGPLAILLFPLTVLRFIIVGDPAEDAQRALNYRYANSLGKEEKDRQLPPHSQRMVREAGRRAGLEWLRSQS